MSKPIRIQLHTTISSTPHFQKSHLFPSPFSHLPSPINAILPTPPTNPEFLFRAMGKGLLDLEKHFAQYGAYHSNPINILIHIIFVWPIFFTALLLFYFTPPFLSLPLSVAASLPACLGDVLVLNFGFFFALVYALFFVSFDVTAGSLGAILCAGCWVGSSILGSSLGFSLAWKVVLAAQLFCWTGQFIGHGAFEGRAPALLDNLSQAFLMAPFFVLLEVLQKLFRYEPYPGFSASVQTKIESNINEWKANKQKKSS